MLASHGGKPTRRQPEATRHKAHSNASANPRAFVQSGFDEVRSRSARKSAPRTSQKPLNSFFGDAYSSSLMGANMTLRRYELSDFEWSIIEPLLPNKPRGVPRSDDRKVLNGIYWRLRTGSPWAEIPERYGPSTTCYNRFVRWARIGVWDRIFEAISKAYDGDLQMIDSSSIRVHQHGANGKKGGLKKRHPPLGTSLEPAAWGAREAD